MVRHITKEQRGWCFYDWANSAFSTTVVAIFFGPYLTNISKAAARPDGFVYPLGIPVLAESFFPYIVSLSALLQIILLPIIGALADHLQRKKYIFILLAYIGAAATVLLYFLEGSNYLFGGTLFVIANMALGGSITVYNALLPEISKPDERDRTSAHGSALGYLGSGLLLIVNLGLLQAHDALGLTSSAAIRINLLSAGLWWAGFTLIPLRALRSRSPAPRGQLGAHVLAAGFRQLWGTLRATYAYPQTLLFLVAYLFYNDGVQTVNALAGTYAVVELKLSQSIVIIGALVVQFIAFFGVSLFGALTPIFGTKQVVLASLFVWIALIIISYFLEAGAVGQFIAFCIVLGTVHGSTYALSRSLFSHFIPRGQEAQYFSLYEVSNRGTSSLGPLIFGMMLQRSGSYRTAVISIIAFFIIGFIMLLRVDAKQGIQQAGNPEPQKI